MTAKHPNLRAVVRQYYHTRIVKVLPAYALGLGAATALAVASGAAATGGPSLIYQYWFAECPQLIWKNALFCNNQGMPPGCGELQPYSLH